MNMRFEWIILMIIISWIWDPTTDLYPGKSSPIDIEAAVIKHVIRIIRYSYQESFKDTIIPFSGWMHP
jgi:hypothetical protein